MVVSEIQSEMIYERCKYFDFCPDASEMLTKDVLALKVEIRKFDKHLQKRPDGTFDCACEGSCPPLLPWCTLQNLTGYRKKAARAHTSHSDYVTPLKRRKLDNVAQTLRDNTLFIM